MTVEGTGDERVDAVVARLAGVDELDLPGQLTVFTDAQSDLAAVLDAEPVPTSDPPAVDAAPTTP